MHLTYVIRAIINSNDQKIGNIEDAKLGVHFRSKSPKGNYSASLLCMYKALLNIILCICSASFASTMVGKNEVKHP